MQSCSLPTSYATLKSLRAFVSQKSLSHIATTAGAAPSPSHCPKSWTQSRRTCFSLILLSFSPDLFPCFMSTTDRCQFALSVVEVHRQCPDGRGPGVSDLCDHGSAVMEGCLLLVQRQQCVWHAAQCCPMIPVEYGADLVGHSGEWKDRLCWIVLKFFHLRWNGACMVDIAIQF